jgi:hypothetical protein
MTEVILDKVDRLTGIEKMRGDSVTKQMYVTVSRGKAGQSGVASEERLDLTFPEAALPTDEQSDIIVGACSQVCIQHRDEALERYDPEVWK